MEGKKIYWTQIRPKSINIYPKEHGPSCKSDGRPQSELSEKVSESMEMEHTEIGEDVK